MKPTLWLAPVCLLLLGCGLIYAFSPALPKISTRHIAREDWLMPKEKRIDQLNVQRLKERNLWGESVASTVATSEPLNSPDWNIIGVANTGVKAYILLSFNNQPDKLIELKQGDSLPGGAKILAIEQDKIRILLNGKSRQLFLQRD